MFLQWIGVNEKFVNLDAIALIEDDSTDEKPVAVLTTIDGIEIRLEGDDAELVFTRAELLTHATDRAIAQFAAQGVAQP